MKGRQKNHEPATHSVALQGKGSKDQTFSGAAFRFCKVPIQEPWQPLASDVASATRPVKKSSVDRLKHPVALWMPLTGSIVVISMGLNCRGPPSWSPGHCGDPEVEESLTRPVR